MKKILVAIVLLLAVVFSVVGCNNDPSTNPSTDPSTTPSTTPSKEPTKDPTKDPAKEYTVTFDVDGGSAVAAQTVKDGEKATKPADPTKEGYTFAGWFVGETAYDFEAAVKSDVTVKAKWTENTPSTPTTYTVTFDVEGGSAVAAQTVKDGEKATKPADPTKEGFTFAGWFVGETAYDFEAAVKSDVTVKAKWTQITYTVTFDVDGGSAVAAQTVAHGAKATKPADPTKDGFTFAGWFVGETAYDFEAAVKSDVTVKAKWTQITYTVTFDVDGGSAVAAQTVAHGAKATKPADPTKDGFTFAGWFVGETAYDFETAVAGNITLKAKWEEEVPDLTAIAGTWTGEETVFTMTNSYEFVINANGTITASYNNGYTDVVMTINSIRFKNNTLTINYDAASTKGADMVFTLSDDKGILSTSSAAGTYPLELKKNYTVTFDYNYEGSSDPKVVKVEHGSTAKKETKTRAGYTLVGWFNGDKEFDFNTPITSDITLTAKWETKKYTVTFYNQDGGIAKEIKVDYNHVLTDADIPTTGIITKDGYKFNGNWYGSLTATSPKDLSKGISEDKEYYPGVIAPMTDVAGTWKGTDSKGAAYTLVMDAATQTVTLTIVKDGKTEECNIASIYFKEFVSLSSTTTKLIIRYIATGSTSQTSLTLTYKEGTFTGSNSLTLEKEGVKKYTVTFNSDGGSTVTAQTVVAGEPATEPTAPTRDGFNFDGWYLGEDKYEFNTPVNGDITLTAKWKEITATYTVKFVYVNPTSGAETEKGSFSVSGGELFDISNKPVETKPSGYTFMGWYNGDVLFDFNTPITSDITLTSKYKGVDRKVTFYNQDKTICKEIYVENGKSLPENEIPVPKMNDGYVFNGVWMKSAVVSAAPQVTTAITSDTKYYPAYVSTKITALEGTWVDASGTYKFEITVDDVTMVTTAKFSIDGGNTTYNAESVQFDGAQLIIKYYQTGSTSIKQIKITYDEANGAVKYAASSSNIIDLVKQA